jgi:hypothetical protein
MQSKTGVLLISITLCFFLGLNSPTALGYLIEPGGYIYGQQNRHLNTRVSENRACTSGKNVTV